jgi:hypothetical protein
VSTGLTDRFENGGLAAFSAGRACIGGGASARDEITPLHTS